MQNGDWICLNLKIKEWDSVWEQYAIVLFGWEYEDSQIRKSITEDVDNKLENTFGENKENVSELRSEAVLRLGGPCGVFTEEDASSILLCTKGVTGLSQDESVESSDIWCLKELDFLATALAKGGVGNRNGSSL